MEHKIGETWFDGVTGWEVVTMADTNDFGCRSCVFRSSGGGACPGAEYDRHPCGPQERSDGSNVYYKPIRFIPERKDPPRKIKLF